MTYGDFKDLARRTDSDNINTNANDKIKQSPLPLATHQLAEELHKPIIRKF